MEFNSEDIFCMIYVMKKPNCYGNCLDLKQQRIFRLSFLFETSFAQFITHCYKQFLLRYHKKALVFNDSLETLGIGKILL